MGGSSERHTRVAKGQQRCKDYTVPTSYSLASNFEMRKTPGDKSGKMAALLRAVHSSLKVYKSGQKMSDANKCILYYLSSFQVSDMGIMCIQLSLVSSQ